MFHIKTFKNGKYCLNRERKTKENMRYIITDLKYLYHKYHNKYYFCWTNNRRM